MVEMNGSDSVEILIKDDDSVQEQTRYKHLILMEKNLMASCPVADDFGMDEFQGIVFIDLCHTDCSVMVIGSIESVSVSSDIAGGALFITDRIKNFSFPADQRNSRAALHIGRSGNDSVLKIDVFGIVNCA